MPGGSKLRVFIACSLDGFIAGDDDDLGWLPQSEVDAEASGYEAFMSEIGALLMGRRTYEVVCGFGLEVRPYGERPVLVATHRALEPAAGSVRAASGTIHELVAEARRAAGELDVYLDGGELIRQALDAELIDELVVSIAPVILGGGRPLFAGASRRHALELVEQRDIGGGMVQLRYRRVPT